MFSSRSRSAGDRSDHGAELRRGIRPSRSARGLPIAARSRSWASFSCASDAPDQLLRLVLGQDAFLDELFRVQLAHGRVARDQLRHQRLRVRRLVLLVVAVPPVTDEIDHDVVAEARAERRREPVGGERRLGVVGVDVDDRHVEALREVARMAGRACVAGSVVKPTWLFAITCSVPPVE